MTQSMWWCDIDIAFAWLCKCGVVTWCLLCLTLRTPHVQHYLTLVRVICIWVAESRNYELPHGSVIICVYVREQNVSLE